MAMTSAVLTSRYSASRPILSVRSYTDLPRPGKHEPVFSRDCPEYTVELSGGQILILLGNHFKSQGHGDKASNDAKRLDQANAVKTIYQAALQRSQFVVVAGDLNAGPEDPSVAPIVKNAGLKEVMDHPSYNGLPGTFGTGTNRNRQKFDYILLSPALWARVQAVAGRSHLGRYRLLPWSAACAG